jgi:glycosyltransferase involved in cell wall biosynthesis
VIVADDGSTDGTAEQAERAGARVLRLPARGKGQALTLAEREAPPGAIVVCDADLAGDLRPLAAADGGLAIAVFAERQGGGFGIAKSAARALIRARSGFVPVEPLSGQRVFSRRPGRSVFRSRPVSAARSAPRSTPPAPGSAIAEVELPLRHRATGRDARLLHRGRQLLDAVLRDRPQAATTGASGYRS